MSEKNIAAFGIYPDQVAVSEAVDALKRTGFRNTDISILLPDNVGSKDLGVEKHTKVSEGATAGTICGALIGGALAWLAGIGAVGIPGGLGPFSAAGPIVMILSGIGAGCIVGGLVGALVGVAIPEYEAKRYEGRSRHGGILLSVHCDNLDWTKRAKEALRHSGAKGIAARRETRADFGTSEKPLARTRITGVLEQANSTNVAIAGSQPEDLGPTTNVS